jgi:hypothetical protein
MSVVASSLHQRDGISDFYVRCGQAENSWIVVDHLMDALVARLRSDLLAECAVERRPQGR